MPRNLIENREIRIFISSTFRDMQDERDYLITKTFPMLRKKAAERDVTLTELDLRWGITEEESNSGKVVEICLEEIENSVPFFIGIIGGRYGWCPEKKDILATDAIKERFGWVYDDIESGLSVTEIEMQYGVLRRGGNLNAAFYIKKGPDATEDADNPEMLRRFKKDIRENGRYPVDEYTSPDDLAEKIEARFEALLDKLFPIGELSALEKERIGQMAFLNQLSQSYVRVQKNFEVLDQFLTNPEQQYMVVVGASGLGKSALIANWIKEKIDSGIGRSIVYHFIGNGGSLGSHFHVIEILCQELKDQYHLEVPVNGQDEWEKNDEKLLEKLYGQIAVEKPCLIVLDAVNQLIGENHAKQMTWLGYPPKNTKVLFTTLKDDATMEVFKQRRFPIFELKPLDEEDRMRLVRDYLSLYGKRLKDNQVERIIKDRQSENTLVLHTLLDELISFGIYEELDTRIEYYLESDSIEDFYQRVLGRFEWEFGKDTVKHVLSLIALSRSGLTEEDIIALTGLSRLHWSQLYCNLLTNINVKQGLVNFSHKYFADAVRQRYLDGNSDFEREERHHIFRYFKTFDTEFAWDESSHQCLKLKEYDYLYNLVSRKDVGTLANFRV